MERELRHALNNYLWRIQLHLELLDIALKAGKEDDIKKHFDKAMTQLDEFKEYIKHVG